MSRRKVNSPAPECPIIPTIWLDAISRLTFLTAIVVPKCLVSPSSLSIAYFSRLASEKFQACTSYGLMTPARQRVYAWQSRRPWLYLSNLFFISPNLFVERSLINELVPSYDRGVMGYGSIKQGIVSYFLGGFNGTGQNTSDNNGDKDIAARLVLAPWKTSDNFWLKGFQIAGNFTWGNESGLASAQGRTEARTPNRFVYFAAQLAQGDRLRYGGDLAWLVGPAGVKFEYDVQTNQRHGLGPQGSDLDKVTAKGWYVSGTYLLTGEDKQLSAQVHPTYPFAPIAGKWGPGAWEVGFRYADLSFSSDAPVNFFNGNLTSIPGGGKTAENGAEALTLGVNWYPNAQTRLMLNSTTYWYDNGLGTPYSCPHTCTTSSNLQRSHETSWEILSRVQFFW